MFMDYPYFLVETGSFLVDAGKACSVCVALEGAGGMGGGSPAQPFLRHHVRGGGCKMGVHSPGNGAVEVVPTKLSSRPPFLQLSHLTDVLWMETQ